MKKPTKLKIIFAVAAFAVNILCTAAVPLFSIETTAMKVIGSYAALGIITLAAWRFPLRFYLFSLAFGVLASSLGSAVNLYQSVGFYDIFIHFLSGVLLAEGGFILAGAVLKKRNLPDDLWVKLLTAFFFSSACAAFWEVYEFTADRLANANMQGDNGNTMGDIIAGVLGAAIYFAAAVAVKAVKQKKNSRQ